MIHLLIQVPIVVAIAYFTEGDTPLYGWAVGVLIGCVLSHFLFGRKKR